MGRSARDNTARLRNMCVQVWYMSMLELIVIVYIVFFSSMAHQEALPIVAQLVKHAQKIDWGVCFVKGWDTSRWVFITDWREAALDIHSARAQGYNMAKYLKASERELVLSAFGVSIMLFMVSFLSLIFNLIYLQTKYREEGREYYREVSVDALQFSTGSNLLALAGNVAIFLYLVISGYKVLCDAPGSHVYFGIGFAVLLSLCVVSGILFSAVLSSKKFKRIDDKRKAREEEEAESEEEARQAYLNGSLYGGGGSHCQSYGTVTRHYYESKDDYGQNHGGHHYQYYIHDGNDNPRDQVDDYQQPGPPGYQMDGYHTDGYQTDDYIYTRYKTHPEYTVSRKHYVQPQVTTRREYTLI